MISTERFNKRGPLFWMGSFCVLLLLGSMFFSSYAYAVQGYGVDVHLESSSPQRVKAGQTANFTFEVNNTSNRGEDFVSKVIMPDNFGAPYPDPFHFSLVLNGGQTQELSIYVPHSTPPGRYVLYYRVEGMNNPIFEDVEEFIIEVMP